MYRLSYNSSVILIRIGDTLKILNSKQIQDYSNKRLSKIDSTIKDWLHHDPDGDLKTPKSFLSHDPEKIKNVLQKNQSHSPVVMINNNDQHAFVEAKPQLEKKLMWAGMGEDAKHNPHLKTFDSDLKSGFITKPAELIDNQFLATNSPYHKIYENTPKTKFDKVADLQALAHPINKKPNAVKMGQYLNKNPKLASSLGLTSNKHNVPMTKDHKPVTALEVWRKANDRTQDMIDSGHDLSRSEIMNARLAPINAYKIGKHDPQSGFDYLKNHMDDLTRRDKHNILGHTAELAIKRSGLNDGNATANKLGTVSKQICAEIRYRANLVKGWRKWTVPYVSGLHGQKPHVMSNLEVAGKSRDKAKYYGNKVAKNFKHDPILSHANIANSLTEDKQQLHYSFDTSNRLFKKADNARKPAKAKEYSRKGSQYSHAFNDLSQKFAFHFTQRVANKNPKFKMLSDRFQGIDQKLGDIKPEPAKFASVDFHTGKHEEKQFSNLESNAIYNNVKAPKILNHTDDLAKKDPAKAKKYYINATAQVAKKIPTQFTKDDIHKRQALMNKIHNPSAKNIKNLTDHIRLYHGIPDISGYVSSKQHQMNAVRSLKQDIGRNISSGVSNVDLGKSASSSLKRKPDYSKRSSMKKSHKPSKMTKLAHIKRNRGLHR